MPCIQHPLCSPGRPQGRTPMRPPRTMSEPGRQLHSRSHGSRDPSLPYRDSEPPNMTRPRFYLPLTLTGLLAAVLVFLAPPTLAAPPAAAPQKVATVEGHHRVPARQRPPRPALPRPVVRQGHRNMTVLVGSRTRATARPAWPTCSNTWSSRARPTHPRRAQGPAATTAPQFNGTTWVDRTNYFETMPRHRREPRVRHPPRSRSPGQQLRQARGPASRK